MCFFTVAIEKRRIEVIFVVVSMKIADASRIIAVVNVKITIVSVKIVVVDSLIAVAGVKIGGVSREIAF